MFHKAKEKWNNLRLANKMLLVYLMLLGVMCVVTITAMQVNLNIYDEKLYEKSLQELDFFVQQVNGSLREVETFSYDIAMSVDMQQRLSTMRSHSHLQSQYNYELYQLRSLLTTEIYTHPIVKSITYTDQFKNEVIVGEYTGTIDPEVYTAMLDRMHEAHGGYITLSPSEEYPYLLSGRDILKHTDFSMDYLGTYIIACDVAGVIETQMSALSAPQSELFVCGPEGSIFQSGGQSDPVRPPNGEPQGYDVLQLNGQRYFTCWLTDKEYGWTYLNQFPYSDIYGQIIQMRYMVCCLTAWVYPRKTTGNLRLLLPCVVVCFPLIPIL